LCGLPTWIVNIDYRQRRLVNGYRVAMTRLTTAQAAERLGVKPSTIYAYVSRGILASRPSPDGRSSTFSVSAIEQVARRGRPRQATQLRSLDFTIDTAVTQITQQRLSYRGHDAVSLCATATFEQVADLLLTGSMPRHYGWATNPLAIEQLSNPCDHLALIALETGSLDPLRTNLDRSSVANAARLMITAAVDSRPTLGDGRTPRLVLGDEQLRSTLAARLWMRLSPRRPTVGTVNIVNAALVLLADHELAVSTVAARVAASARADAYAVVAAGVAAMRGPLHGGASRRVRHMLDEAMSSSSIDIAVSHAGQLDGRYPGFGHAVYKAGDPRADALLNMMRAQAGGSRAMGIVDGVIATVRRRHDIHPNIDLALAAFGAVHRLPLESGETIFSVARVAGWVAHALEEYDAAPLRFRAQARYLTQPPKPFD
jgi:citrate synthase